MDTKAGTGMDMGYPMIGNLNSIESGNLIVSSGFQCGHSGLIFSGLNLESFTCVGKIKGKFKPNREFVACMRLPERFLFIRMDTARKSFWDPFPAECCGISCVPYLRYRGEIEMKPSTADDSPLVTVFSESDQVTLTYELPYTATSCCYIKMGKKNIAVLETPKSETVSSTYKELSSSLGWKMSYMGRWTFSNNIRSEIFKPSVLYSVLTVITLYPSFVRPLYLMGGSSYVS